MQTDTVRLTCRLVAASSLVAMVGGGCHLFGEYDVPSDAGGEPVDTGDSDADTQARDASDVEDTDVEDTARDADGADDTTGDTRDTVAVDTADGVDDTEPVDSSEPSDTDAADGGDGDGGLPENKCPSGVDSYRVRPARMSPAIDGKCTDAEFKHARRVPFPPPGTTNATPSNTSDNKVDCKVVWLAGQPARLHGCCEVEDDDLFEDTEQGDPVEEIFGGNGRTPDDRIEVHMRCDMQEKLDNCSYKTFMNNHRPEPIHYAFNSEESGRTEWENNYKGRTRETTDGYVVEWAGNVGFLPESGDFGRCNFAVFDTDNGTDNGEAMAFGPGISINHPEDWGCCFFE